MYFGLLLIKKDREKLIESFRNSRATKGDKEYETARRIRQKIPVAIRSIARFFTSFIARKK